MSTDWYFQDTNRNGKHVIYKGYSHSLDRTRNETKYYKCMEVGCKARIILRDGVVSSSKEHSHPPDGIKIARKQYKNAIAKAAVEDPTASLVQLKKKRVEINANGVSGATSDELEHAIPSFDSIKSAAYRKRAKLLPPAPQTLAEVEISGVWSQTQDGRQFLLANEGSDQRIVLFATESFLRRLCEADCVFMDGTFRVCPTIFHQLYTLHVFIHGLMVPCVYALLPSKSTETYRKMFQLIRNAAERIGLNFAPQNFQIDYEMAMIRAIKEEFSANTMIKGCLFHFGQAIWRKVQSLALATLYTNNNDFKKLVRRVCGLALVPLSLLDDIWLEIHGEAPDDNGVEEFLSYFVATYFDNDVARFDRSMWNHYSTNGTRTTNHLEGWHNALNRAVGRYAPTLFYLIKELKTQQEAFEIDIRVIQNGNGVRRQRKKYRDIEEKLRITKERLSNGEITPIEYLDIVKYIYVF